jgi:hypothetical protein
MQRFLKKIKMQMSMTFQEKKVTRHVGEWILNTYSPTANFGRIGEWASGYPQHCRDLYLVTPAVTWGLGFFFLVLISHLLQYTRGC